MANQLIVPPLPCFTRDLFFDRFNERLTNTAAAAFCNSLVYNCGGYLCDNFGRKANADEREFHRGIIVVIESIHVQNFRCIRNEELPCKKLTALVGPNGAGKSSFLQALNVFFNPNAKCTEDDFYDRDTTQDIIIRITFSDLSTEEMEKFGKCLRDGKLAVEKVLQWSSGKLEQKYYGTIRKNPEFEPFRLANGPQLKAEYTKLKQDKYESLPSYTKKDLAEKELQKLEEAHPEECSDQQREEVHFFGYKGGGLASIEQYTRFIFVPAVRDASEDATDASGTPLMEIMDLLVRSVLEQREEIVELQERTLRQYREIVDPDKLGELQDLEQGLNDTLQTYIPDAGIKLSWRQSDIDIPMPKADIKLLEHNYLSSVERSGHGLQRAFILTLLQHLALAQSVMPDTAEGTETGEHETRDHKLKGPNLIIAIEEPELYQHPCRQRHLSRILHGLTEAATGASVQIIYSTHSPLFIDLARFDSIRILRKAENSQSGKPKHTNVTYATFDQVVRRLEKIDKKSPGTYTRSQLEARSLTLMTPLMNEGFFADLAVLVEGEGDRVAILTVAEEMQHDLDAMGISIIPCMSKSNLCKPAAIFYYLAVPFYIIWDSDHHKHPRTNHKDNHKLLRCCDQEVEDWPDNICDRFACFKESLNLKLRTEIGETLYDGVVAGCKNSLNLKGRDVEKHPQVIREIIAEAYQKGKRSQTLESIVDHIVTRAKSL